MSGKKKSKKYIKDNWLLLAVVLSGAVALGYEMMWTRLLGLVVGGELLGILGVLAGFFGGMTLGAFWFSKKAVRSKSPIKVFFILEGAIALYGLFSPHIIHYTSSFLPAWLGHGSSQSGSLLSLSIVIICVGLILLPATIGMGANFAFLVEAWHRNFPGEDREKGLAKIYAANTFGAVLGIFLSIYLIMPAMGFKGAAVVFSILGTMSILSAFFWSKNVQAKTNSHQKLHVEKEITTSVFRNPYLLILFFTGLLGVGLEILIVHHFKQILQNTIFSFGNLLAVYLLGNALGAWLFQRFYQKKVMKSPLLLMGFLATAVLLASLMLSNASDILFYFTPENDTAFSAHIFAELKLAILVFLLPTVLMGMIFSYFISKVSREKLGVAYGINTLGAVLAPFIFGLVLIPQIGGQMALVVCWAAYVLIILWGIIRWSWSGRPLILAGINILLLTGFLFKGVNLVKIIPGYDIVEKHEGLMGVVAVMEKEEKVGPYELPARVLQVNNRFRMGGGAGFLERRIGNLSLLMADSYENALFLGIGTGTTLGVIADYPFREVDAVEIVKEVKEVLPLFDEHNLLVSKDSRVNFHLADARRFINGTRQLYDFILVDLFHPARDGAGLLFGEENFELLRDRLSDDGLLTFWLPIHQFDSEGLKMVVRTFLSVFPNAHALIGSYSLESPVIALVASPKDISINSTRVKDFIRQHYNVSLAVENTEDLVASYLMDGKGLAQYAGDGPLNTDLFPRLLFHAPKHIYESEAKKAEINIAELRKYRTSFPANIFEFESKESQMQAQKTWRAVGIFLEGNEAMRQGNWRKTLKDYIRAYKIDPSFSPARGKLFQYALERPSEYDYIYNLLKPTDRQRLDRIRQGFR